MSVSLFLPASHSPDPCSPVPKHLLAAFLFLICLAGEAQQVTIQGTATSYPGKELVAYRYQDYITWTRELLESDTVDKQGSFTLHLDVKAPTRIYLLCNHLKTPLYVEPGRSYVVDFPRKDSSRLLNQQVDQDGDLNIHPIRFKQNGAIDTTELNWLIIDYNLRFDDFWRKNYQAFVIKRMKAPLDSFSRAIHKHFATVPNAYFQSYIDYSIASTRVSTLESQNILYRDYLVNRPVGYGNFEYMTFFNQFFDKFFYQFALKPTGTPLFDAINQRGDLNETLNDLKPAPYMSNDTLRELLLLKGLNENFHNKEFSQQRMLQILEEVSHKSKVPAHRLIARNMIAAFGTLKAGSPAPAFTLPDKNGKLVNLNDFKGQYVYLTFSRSTSPTCLSDLKVLEELEKKYPLIHVVSIVLDDKPDDLKKMLKQNPKFRWVFLQGGDKETLKHDYHIYAEPYYYLIGPSGKLLLSPAPGPYDDLDELFYQITKKKEGKFKVGEW